MSPKQQIITRKFAVRPPVMLTAATAIGKIFEANIQYFTDYPHMTPEWLAIYYIDIDRMSKKTGVKSDEQQRAATAIIRNIQADATSTGRIIKNQIERGFRNEKPRLAELLNLLGYKANWTKTVNKNHNALIELLFTFSNHADELQNELIAHNVTKTHIDKIKKFAQEMAEANVTQEILKSESPIITSDLNKELNDIYARAIDICSAGKIVFHNDPVKKSLFSFKRLTTNQI